jgi:hypothetical protein
MAYPASLDSYSPIQGTTFVAADDHATRHNAAGSAIVGIETVLGTTAGTSIAKFFAAGDFAVRENTAGVFQHQMVGGTINSLLGTTPTFVNPTNTGGTYGGTLTITGTALNGVFNSPTLGTPIVNHFTSTGTTVPSVADRALAPTVVTLTDVPGGTIAVNAPSAQVFHMILGTTAGNRTLAAPTNATEGQVIIFRTKQNTNNTGTIVYNAIYRFGQAGTPTLGTQSTYNYSAFRYNGVDTKWDHAGNSLGLI